MSAAERYWAFNSVESAPGVPAGKARTTAASGARSAAAAAARESSPVRSGREGTGPTVKAGAPGADVGVGASGDVSERERERATAVTWLATGSLGVLRRKVGHCYGRHAPDTAAKAMVPGPGGAGTPTEAPGARLASPCGMPEPDAAAAAAPTSAAGLRGAAGGPNNSVTRRCGLRFT